MSKKEHSIWVERYRPQTIEEYLTTSDIKSKVETWVKEQQIPHIGLFGKAGSGKSTLAKILANSIDCDFLYLNAAEERSMDVLKERVGKFAQASSFKPMKIIILDESTHILQASQVLLLNMIETYSLKTRFILTGNYPERLIEPLRSRLQEFELTPPPKKEIANYVSDILDKEDVKYEPKDLVEIVNKFYPDQRKIINTCQKYTVNGELSLAGTQLSSNDYQTKILSELQSSTSKSFNVIRQIIADSGVSDFTDIFRFLFENMSSYSKNNDGTIICYIEEYQYHANFKLDQEINALALISKILQTITKKTTL